MPKRLHVTIKGRVQGVCFRYHASQVAKGLAVVGWVRNTSAGAVELLAEGPESKLRELLTWCFQGPPSAQVDGVDERWAEATGDCTEFGIRY